MYVFVCNFFFGLCKLNSDHLRNFIKLRQKPYAIPGLQSFLLFHSLIFWMTVRAVCTSRNSNQTKENARLFARWALPVGMCPCWWSWLKLVCDFKLVSNHKLSTCNIRECAVSECDPSPRTKAWTSRAWTFLMAIMRHCERTRHQEVMTRCADCCRATGRLWSGSGRCTAGG